MDSARPPRRVADGADTQAFYERDACAYAQATRGADLEHLIERLAGRMPPHGRVLDLGSGSGRDLASFNARRLEAIGLDRSIALAGIASTHARTPVCVGDMVALPFADRVFDGAWACASLLHLDGGGQERALVEVRRVLRPAGLLLSTMKLGTGEAREACGRVYSYVDAELWSARIRDAGFEILELATQTESRGPHDVGWLTCLSRVR